MKISQNESEKVKKNNSMFKKLIIGLLLIILFFLSGALFQQRGLDLILLNSINELKFTIINDLNLVQNNGLPTLYINIPYKSLNKIYQKRSEALAARILMASDDDFVPADIRIDQGKELEVDIRLKGDWTDHLETNKWSYRVHVKNGDMILGAKRFSIQAPETRNFIAEWAFHQHCFYEGILTTNYTFVNVFENGVYKGIFAFEESFSEELIESQEHREGLILKFDEEFSWVDRANYINTGSYWTAADNQLFTITNSVESTTVTTFRDSYLMDSPQLFQQRNRAISLLASFIEGKISAKSAFDIEKTGKYFALSDFWAANHSAHWINMRFFYNPVTGLLEPIAYDGFALNKYTNNDILGNWLFETTLLNDPEIRAVYNRELQYLTQEDVFKNFKNTIYEQANHFQKLLRREYFSLEPIWDQIETRRKLFYVLVRPENPIRGNFDIDYFENKLILNIRLKNLTLFPVEIKKVYFGDKLIQIPGNFLDTSKENKIIKIDNMILMDFNKKITDLMLPETFLTIPLDIENEFDPMSISVKVLVEIGNHEKEVNLTQLPLSNIYNIRQLLLPSSSIEELIEQHPFLQAGDNGNLFVPKGTWHVKGDLIIPEGVTLNLVAGTHLRFETDALLLLRGGSLNIQGTPENYSSLSSVAESWAGILVIDAPEESFWQYTEVSNIKGFERKGWMVTGGITFYQSDVTITDSVIKNSFSEDAINIMHSDYLFNNISIGNTISDAFDGDFSDGKIENSYFYQINGDAVDISGSTLNITSCNFDTIGDKGISAGEQSEVNALYVNITNANIGVASKDLSTVKIELSEINNPRYIALTAYQKKAMYGPGSIEAKNITVRSEDKISLVQNGSSVKLNDQIMPSQELDVKTLYDLGILGN